jgi:hypothetical protein
MTVFSRRGMIVALLLAVFGLVGGLARAGGAVVVGPGPPLRQVSTDSFTNPESQHATQVEADTFASGRTVVAAFQSGRYVDGGASGIAYAVSHNGGVTWPAAGILPFLTVHSDVPGPYDRASDPAVAYDAAHDTWLISSLVVKGTVPVAIATSRSADGGATWSAPSVIPGTFYDKNWIVCDDTPSSPHYGNCYTTWDDFANVDLLLSSTSSNGGLTWSPPLPTADRAIGIGGQPVVQPDGTVIVPAANAFFTEILAYRSTDGGASWSATVKVSDLVERAPAGGLRAPPFPSAEIAADGTVYMAWQDCRYRPACGANDILLVHSRDGISWSPPSRVPIDPVTSASDHFIPGLGVDATTSGATTRLALTYHFYPDADCTPATCQLHVGFISSSDAASTWTEPQQLTTSPMSLAWLPATNQGVMVGDYMSTSFAGPWAVTIFAVADAKGAAYHQSMHRAVRQVHPGRGVKSASPEPALQRQSPTPITAERRLHV